MMNFNKLLKVIKEIVYQQGTVLKNAFGNFQVLEYEIKKDNGFSDIDIVTRYDKEIELAIHKRLSQEFPELGFYLEEHPEMNDTNKEFICYIDPIDGTKYFAKGVPLFNISIGVITSEGAPVLGVTYNPLADQLHAGAEGINTTLNGREVKVSKTDRLEDAFIVLDVSTHKENWETDKDWMNRKIVEFNLKAERIRMFAVGSASCSWVAHGGLDAYISIWGHGSKPFDIAAGKALIKYAKGGKIVDMKIPGLSHTRFVGGNERLVEEICEVLLK